MAMQSPWNEAAEDFVIVPLLSILKRNRRWSRDGRSLRTLNRHWCATVTRHVTDVRPHQSRVLCLEDIDALTKFRNVCHVDTRSFEGRQGRHLETRCQRLADVLSKLPRLSQLTVGKFFDCLDDPRIVHLPGLTSLECADHVCHAFKIPHLPLKHLSAGFRAKDLIQWISRTPSLRTIDVRLLMPSNHENNDRLMECTEMLHSIRLVHTSYKLNALLPRLTNLVALQIFSASPELFCGLHRLTSLNWEMASAAHVKDSAFKNLVVQLESLTLQGFDESTLCRLPDDLILRSTKLEALSLFYVQISQGFIDSIAERQLKHLSLRYCRINASLSPIEKMATLEGLSLAGFCQDTSILGMRMESLSGLTNLSIEHASLAKNKRLIAEIGHLPKLESLALFAGVLYENHPLFVEGLGGHDSLPKLSVLVIGGKMPKPAVDQFFRLKVLNDLDTLDLRLYPVDKKAVEAIEKNIYELLVRVPYLKIKRFQ